jgi:hypothetical protein
MRRGQTVLSLIVVVTSMILVWVFLGGVINEQILLANNLTPMEQFFLNNINLAIGVALLFFTVVGLRRFGVV